MIFITYFLDAAGMNIVIPQDSQNEQDVIGAIGNNDFWKNSMGVSARLAKHSQYVDMVINRFPRFIGNQVTFI